MNIAYTLYKHCLQIVISLATKAVSIYPDEYSVYVVEKLLNIKGKSKSEVINYIIHDWISENFKELENYGINVKNARKEKKLSTR